MHRGYFKIWRKIEDSGLYQMPNTLALLMFLLSKAMHKDCKVGTALGVVDLKRGQYISGRIQLAADLKQTEREIRTSLSRLIELEIIAQQTTSKYSIYTIVNYGKYQDCDQQTTSTMTGERPANDQQTTTKEDIKELKNENIKPIVTSQADDDCPHNKIIALYHEILPELVSVRIWNEKRKKLLKTRWRESEDRRNMEFWKRFFSYVRTSDFLMGKKTTFQVSLPWMLNAENFAKIIEGNYDNR